MKKQNKKIYSEVILRGNSTELMSFKGHLKTEEFEMLRDVIEIIWKLPQGDSQYDDLYKEYYKELVKFITKFNTDIYKLN